MAAKYGDVESTKLPTMKHSEKKWISANWEAHTIHLKILWLIAECNLLIYYLNVHHLLHANKTIVIVKLECMKGD